MKKFISAVIVLMMLVSSLPMAYASEENVINVSATKETVIGYAENGQESVYGIKKSVYGTNAPLDNINEYGYYRVERNKLLDYKVSVAESGRYKVKMRMAGFDQTDYYMNIYVDECLQVSKNLPPCPSGVVEEIGDINLTAGEHILGVNVEQASGGGGIRLKSIFVEKIGSLNSISFRAADYEATHEQTTASEYNKFNGVYSDYSYYYGKSDITTKGGTVLEYNPGITTGGTYTLSANMKKNEAKINVYTGKDYNSKAIKIENFNVSSAKEWGYPETTETASVTIGDVEIAAGEKLYIETLAEQTRLYYFELKHITPLACLDELNACKDPYEVKGILAKYNGQQIDGINDKLKDMYFSAFIGSELINKNFASFEELNTAFDAAYAKEADEHKIRLHYNGRNGGRETGSVTEGSSYHIKIKEGVLPTGTQVIFAKYTDESRISLDKAVIGKIEDGKELTLTMWLNPGEGVGLFFWNSMETLTPTNIFFQ